MLNNPQSVLKSSIQPSNADKLVSLGDCRIEYISEVSDARILRHCSECHRLVMTDSVFDMITAPRMSDIKCSCISFNIASLRYFVDYHSDVSKVTLSSVQTVEVHLVDSEVEDTIDEYISAVSSVFPNVRDVSFMTKNISSSNVCRLLNSHRSANTNR